MNISNKLSLSEQSISFQTITYGLAQCVGFLRGFFSLFILSRILHVNDFGILGVLYSFSNLATSIILLGVTSSVRIVIPALKRPEREAQFWGLVQVVGAISIVTLIALWIAYRPIQTAIMVPEVTRELFLLALILIPLTALELLFQSQVTNNNQGRQFVRVTSITAISDLGLSVAGAFLFGVRGVLYGVLIGKAVVVLWLAFIIHQHDPFVPLSFRILRELKSFFRYGFLIFVSGLSARVIDSSGRFTIAHSWGSEAVGFFQVAYNLCGPLNRVAGPIYLALMPFLVAGIAAKDGERVRHYLKTALQLLLVVFCPMVLFLSLNSKSILQLVVTKELSNGWAIIPFVSLGFLFLQAGGVYCYNVLAHQKVHLMVVSTFTGAIVNVVLNLLLIPRLGIVGAAVSLTCSYFFTAVLDYFFSQRIAPFRLEGKVWAKLTISLIAMAIIIYLTRLATSELNNFWGLAITGMAATSVYCWGVLHFDLLSNDSLDKIRDSFRLLFRLRI